MKYSTTNVRIETNSLKELKLRAIDEGRRVAELIREAIRSYLQKAYAKTAVRKSKKDTILSIVGMCKTDVRNGSERHDELLYGRKK